MGTEVLPQSHAPSQKKCPPDRLGVGRVFFDRDAPSVRPAYLDLGLAELRARAMLALDSLRDCQACPRRCRANRLEDRWSACKTGRYAVVSNWFPIRALPDVVTRWPRPSALPKPSGWNGSTGPGGRGIPSTWWSGDSTTDLYSFPTF